MNRHPILFHPRWLAFRKWLHVTYGIQGQYPIRVRVETRTSIKKEMQEVTLICHCGAHYKPIRNFKGTKELSLMATGPRRDGHWSCSYKWAARYWMSTLILDILGKEEIQRIH